LLGAACLPTRADGNTLGTPFGEFARPVGTAGDVRLVVLPGEVRAAAANGSATATTPTARVLTTAPAVGGFQLRCALGDHLVVASATAPLPVGSNTTLSLSAPPRLLPWQRRSTNLDQTP
ncbi:MAG: hypothetical protein JNK15_14935, partial [Planctomycetes bacterium]|nr:hypothetical protein [Planctomycetota bacterium]